MRLFGYYALHTLINQIRRLFRSWVILFILVCAILGGAIGFLGGTAADKLQNQQVTEETVSEEDDQNQKPSDAFEHVMDAAGMEKAELVHLAMSAAILVILIYYILQVDGVTIFLPADVSLLFSSPLKPQSVLIFRLFARMGLSVFFVIYLAFFILPTLPIVKAGAIGSSLFILSWILVFTLAKLLQVALYLFTEDRPIVKRNLRPGVLALAVVLVGLVCLSSKRKGISVAASFDQILNGRGSNWFPIYGWLKGAMLSSMTGNIRIASLFVLLSILATAGFLVLIYHMKADFYESAMEKTDQLAEKMEKIQESRDGLSVKRKKKRSQADRERKGIRHGFGASVFFFKEMYLRFQGRGYGIITKTSLTYLAAAGIGGYLIHAQWNRNGTIAALLILTLLVFWRSLGNPLGQDTRMAFYQLIPESPWKKLFFSLLAGTVDSFLDLLPAMILIGILFWPDPLLLLIGMGLLLSTDLYATLVSTFLDASIPRSIDKTVRQLVQIVFIYFGMMPDLVVLVLGLVNDHLMEGLIVCFLLNLTISAIFFAVTPLVMEDRKVRLAKPTMESYPYDLKKVRKTFSRIGLGLFLMITVTVLAQLLVGTVCKKIAPALLNKELSSWFLSMLPEYLIGFPAGLLLIRKEKAEAPDKRSLGIGKFLAAIPITAFVLVLGALVGQLVLHLVTLPFGIHEKPPIVMTMSSIGPVWVRILFLVILAPILEEVIFRKILIDRTRCYGEKTAIFFSALAFGLFHGNFNQIFYAFGLGLVFGTIYEKTGRLSYTISIHMAVNFLSSVLVPYLLGGLDSISTKEMTELPSAFLIYMITYYGLAVLGFVVLLKEAASLRFSLQERELPKGQIFRTVYVNPGVVLFLISIIVLVAWQTFY